MRVSNGVHARRKLAIWVTVALAMSTLAACGSRLTTEEIVAQGIVAGDAGSSGNGSGGSNDLAVGEDPDTDDTTPGATDDGGTGGSTGGSSSSGGGSGTGSSSIGSGSSGTGGGTGGGGSNTKAATTSAKKAPIVIGYIGWLSGTGGETMAPTRDTWVAWSRAVNARGGINGHKIELLVGDHGGNESRAVSIAREFVENKGAIALTSGSGGPAVGEYAKSKNIPVIGTIPTGGTWNSNPMQFPPFGGAETNGWGAARLTKRAGKTKLASIYCAESPDCEDGNNKMKRYAAAEGIEVVSEQRYSVVSADYTAECIQMQRSGAEVVYPNGDTGSMVRMAKACSRQGFKPLWISPTMDDTVTSLPEFEGAVAITPTFPWFMRSGSPAIDEYVSAIRTYAPSRLTKSNLFMSEAWVSAKLFEKAAQNVGDKPTSQQILDGLWSMKGETLGGLATGPTARTFTRGQPTPETYCVFDTKLVQGKWTTLGGLTPICR